MATSKKSLKTSKTAHVLNVITGGQEPDEAPEGEPAVPTVQTSSARHAVPPILEVARANDDALSQQILTALEDELGDETQAAPTEENMPMEESAPPAVETAAPAAVGAPAASAPPVETHAPAGRSGPSSRPVTENVDYINVVQALVEEKAPKYMDMLGVCHFPRCIADVKALALSNLPPKYIVVPKSQSSPMLTVYESKYSAAITVQLLAACKTVIEHPRH